MGSELIFRGHKPTNMRRHPDLHPPPTLLTSSTPCSPYASSNVPISNYVRYDFDSSATTQYNERGHWGSKGGLSELLSAWGAARGGDWLGGVD
ncbi:hypothetical protein ACFX2I_004915 [Malus domestica]